MFLRALRICDPEFYDMEIDKIFEIGNNLKYPEHFIKVAFNKAKKTFYSLEPRNDFRFSNLLVLPYFSNLLNVPRLLTHFNVNVVFNYPCSIRSFLIKNSPVNKCGCIYEIPCKDCDKKYIGQSGKEMKVRIQQHKYCVRTGNDSNALFIHLRDFNHVIDWVNAKEIVFCSDLVKRNLIESSFIKNNPNNLLNISPGMYKLDSYLIKLIAQQFSP